MKRLIINNVTPETSEKIIDILFSNGGRWQSGEDPQKLKKHTWRTLMKYNGIISGWSVTNVDAEVLEGINEYKDDDCLLISADAFLVQ